MMPDLPPPDCEHAALLAALEGPLAQLGFERHASLFIRHHDMHSPQARIEAISIRTAYHARTCWLHATVKFPALIALLHTVRPFTYPLSTAYAVPDYRSHLACFLQLKDWAPLPQEIFSPGIRQREDGRLQRARSVPIAALADTFWNAIVTTVLPTMQTTFTLAHLASLAQHPDYPSTGVAGAWPLAALLLGNTPQEAAQAFARNPLALGTSAAHQATAQHWLEEHGIALPAPTQPADEALTQSTTALPPTWPHAWLGGEFWFHPA